MSGSHLVDSSPHVPGQRQHAGSPAGPFWVLPSDATGPSAARRMIREQLVGRLEEFCDTAELLISELVTNAITHGEGPITLCVNERHGALLCEVTDSRPTHPALRTAGVDSESGRGMQLVRILSCRWGVRTHGPGKAVWFELATCSQRCCAASQSDA